MKARKSNPPCPRSSLVKLVRHLKDMFGGGKDHQDSASGAASAGRSEFSATDGDAAAPAVDPRTVCANSPGVGDGAIVGERSGAKDPVAGGLDGDATVDGDRAAKDAAIQR